MGLFDGEPLTWDEVTAAEAKRREADGATIRKASVRGPGKTVMRTTRHRPWADLLGPGPEGKTCGDCQFLERIRRSRTYMKCGLHTITSGPGTDIGAKDPACSFFKSAGGGGVMASRDSITEPPGTQELILRCKAGHEYIEFLTVPMNLTALGHRLKGMNYCRLCGKPGVGVLQGNEYREAKDRLKKGAS